MEGISLKAEQLFNIGSFPITNGLLLAFFVSVVLATFAIIFKGKIKLIPGKVQAIVEIGVDALLNLMHSVLGSREVAEKYFPLIATIFVFILTANWMGLLPGVGSFIFRHGEEAVPLLRSPAADFNFALALAVASVVCTNLLGVITLGFFSHIKKYINFGNPIKFFVGLLESLSEVSKIISFSFRLFGNVLAGEVLLTIIAFLIPYIAPAPFVVMEIFVGIIQAFIFTILTLVFLSVQTAEVEH